MAAGCGPSQPGAGSHISFSLPAGPESPGEGGTAANEGAVKGGTAIDTPSMTASPTLTTPFPPVPSTVDPLVDGTILSHEWILPKARNEGKKSLKTLSVSIVDDELPGPPVQPRLLRSSGFRAEALCIRGRISGIEIGSEDSLPDLDLRMPGIRPELRAASLQTATRSVIFLSAQLLKKMNVPLCVRPLSNCLLKPTTKEALLGAIVTRFKRSLSDKECSRTPSFIIGL